MKNKLLNIGFGNYVVVSRIVGIFNPNSAPMRRIKEDARDQYRLIDATQGRKTRSIIITDSNHVFLSALNTDTIGQRFVSDKGDSDEE
jgi:regulator of extracellular matrix RemA (YlzA/DUF370 family)